MTSAIDPTKPEDGVPASKAELRANLQVVKSELEHGGFAPGLTPVRYGPPASARVEDHLAAIDVALGGLTSFTGLADTPAGYTAQAARFVKVKADESGLEFAPAPGGSGGLTGRTDVQADFGALGDGVSDDTAALQAALTSGAAVVYLPPGIYPISTALQITPGTTVMGAGPGQTVIDATGLDDQLTPAALYCYGSTETLPQLASGFSEGDHDLTFSASVDADVQEWDVIGILDERDSSFMGTSPAHRDGCFVNVFQRNGTRVVVSSGVPRSLPSSRVAGGSTADLTAVRLDRRGVVLRGFRLDCRGLGLQANETTERGSGIELRWLADPVIDHVHVRGAPTTGIVIQRCARGRFTRLLTTGLSSGWDSGLAQYGMSIGGSAFCVLSDSYIQGGRHALDFGSGGGDQPLRQIASHNNLVTASTLECPAEIDQVAPGSVVTWAMSWHEAGYNNDCIGCVINGGASFRGFGHRILNNRIWMPKQEANLPAVKGDHMGPRFGITFRGNHVRSFTNNEMVDIDWDNIESSEPAGVCDISGNAFEMSGSTGAAIIRFIGQPQSGKAHFKISDNIVHSDNSQAFLNITASSGSYAGGLVMGNRLTATMSLGNLADVAEWKAVNMVGADLEVANLPTSSPGGSGRLWNDGGTLKIT